MGQTPENDIVGPDSTMRTFKSDDTIRETLPRRFVLIIKEDPRILLHPYKECP